MAEPVCVVGIDLGTTHCALATAWLEHPKIRGLPIPQLVGPGEVAERMLLPSLLYLAAPGELPEGSRTLPWGAPEEVVGEWARQLGAQSPDRLVASAKSWICHGGVNRQAPILPWNAPESGRHISPFAAQVALLHHLRQVWEHGHPGSVLADQDVVVTVPASFDEVARDLTRKAAAEAQLGDVRLLEEPQAAFYDYLGHHQADLAERLGDARLILVIDVGGGTTDLTLLQVRSVDGGEPKVERIAVGGHLMLGGDNMDAALALFALEKAGLDRPEDASTWSALVASARAAKERLLAADAPPSAVVSYQTRGRRLVGGTKSITLDRQDVTQVLLDGFLPLSGPAEVAEATGRAGLTTLGLPYTQDPAIGRHVCRFLRRHAAAAAEAGAAIEQGLPRPDLLLLNGGVFKAPALAERLSELMAGWYGGQKVPLLEHTSLDLAVAHGAARAALAHRGIGAVVGGGTARAYYIGIDQGDGRPAALCVAPRAMEDGTTVRIDRVFELVVDRPVAFPLFAYAGDRVDDPGTLLDLGTESEDLEVLPAVETTLRDRSTAGTGGTLPVTLQASLNQAGALELYLATVELPPRRWRLQFAVHGTQARAESEPATGASSGASEGEATRPDPKCKDALALLDTAFGQDDPKRVEGVRRDLENLLGPRGQWSGATCRALWDGLMALAPHRGRTAVAELNWLRLCGWCLRPGFGAPGDEGRMDELWGLGQAGLQHPSKAMWAQWWILWRWVAAGLDASRQAKLFAEVRPWLWRDGPTPAGPHKHGPLEMLQMVAALERLDVAAKEAIGELLFERAKKLGTLWPLGRVGARVPFHGRAEDVVPAAVAERWLVRLLAMDWQNAEGASFAAASIARHSGDPARELQPSLRAAVVDRLGQVGAPGPWIDMVLRSGSLNEGDLRRVFGDSLPAGLRLA